jgi:hypothetical protein
MTGPQGQSVRCPTHGIYYRPGEAQGCPKCFEAAGRDVPATPDEAVPNTYRRFSPVTALVGLIVVSGLGWGGYQFLQKMGEKGEDLYAETVEVASRIDPSLVRVQIQALENLVYAEEIEQFSQGSRIQRASMVLYQGVMQRASRLLATRLGAKIVGFGSTAVRSEGVGYATIDMDMVRREWEAVRAEVFHDAAWFRAR